MIDKEDVKSVALFRLAKSYVALLEAKSHLMSGAYNEAINRSYYSMFYGSNAVHILNGHCYKRHKDVIVKFSEFYVRSGVFKPEYGRMLLIV